MFDFIKIKIPIPLWILLLVALIAIIVFIIKKENKVKRQYGFDINKEYRKYSSIVRRKDQSYLVWKNNLLKPYMGINNKDFFINFIKWLESYKRREEYLLKMAASFVLPLIIVLFSLFPAIASLSMSSSQWQDTVQIRIDSELDKTPVESLQESMNKVKIIGVQGYITLLIVLFFIVVYLIIFSLLAYIGLKKIDFYNDCQTIIREAFLL